VKEPPWITVLLNRPWTAERSLLIDQWLMTLDQQAKPPGRKRRKFKVKL